MPKYTSIFHIRKSTPPPAPFIWDHEGQCGSRRSGVDLLAVGRHCGRRGGRHCRCGCRHGNGNRLCNCSGGRRRGRRRGGGCTIAL